MTSHYIDMTRRAKLTAFFVALMQTWAAHAEPSQMPLLNRSGGKPLPNIMLTLDDSGSMTHQYLPEGDFIVNDVSVKFPPDQRVYAHPEEIAKNIWTWRRDLFIDVTYEGVTRKYFYDTRFITAVPPSQENDYLKEADAKLLQYQYRSPQLNTVYYNPAIQYSPWKGSRGDGTPAYSFDTPTAKAANLDPLALDPDKQKYPAGWIDTTSTVDLTAAPKMYAVYWAQRQEPWTTTPPTPIPEAPVKPYAPGLYYLLKDKADPTQTSSYLAYDLNDGSATVSYPWAFSDRAGDCKVTYSTSDTTSAKAPGTTKCDQAKELANFTNWFVFNRSRLFIAQGGLPGVLLKFPNVFRTGWGTLRPGVTYTNGIPSDSLGFNGYTVDGVTSQTVQHGVREWTEDTKVDLTKWLRVLKTYGGTPTRQAVDSVTKYFKRTDSFSPWSSDMINGGALSKPLSCRRAYNIVLTDGYYTPLVTNDNKVGEKDDRGSADVDGLEYPFKDGFSDTLADYVMQSWLTDLQPDIANNEAVAKIPEGLSKEAELLFKIKRDSAPHQHLTYFMLGFGVKGNLLQKATVSPAAYDQTLLDLANCGSGGLCWLDPNLSQPNKIDDLWHAALNSRGRYYSVNDPKELKAAIEEIVKLSGGDPDNQNGLATAAPSLVTSNMKFEPGYTTYTWTGDVKAFELDNMGKAGDKPKWVASEQLPAPADRQIYIWNGNEAVRLATPASALGSPLSATLTDELITFIQGTDSANTRQRTGKLPDFINSTPLLVAQGQNLGYASAGFTGASSYLDYLADKAKRPDGLLFVGGNGGMLHAFSTTTGAERFAYVPGAVVPNLPKLAAPDYGYPGNEHRYFVDGPLVEADVYLGEGSQAQWQNIVVGTLGAGGKAVFALKLNKSDLNVNLDQTAVKWEVTHPDMGFITSTPQIGRLADGSWKVFVGNGSESTTGVASLLVIDIATHDVQSITVPNPTPSVDKLGMGGVGLVVDRNTGNVTNVYAGDSAGRLWRFDALPSGMEKGYNGKPLFTATAPDGKVQPITAAPVVYSHFQGGQVVVFQTGRLMYDTEATSTDLQSIYGIWDKKSPSKPTSLIDPPTITRDRLQSQSFVSLDSDKSQPYYTTSANKIDWATQDGWVFDLAVPNQDDGGATTVYPKGIYDPLRLGPGVLLTAVVPGKAVESCEKEKKAVSYNIFLRALTGSRPSTASMDTNVDGKVDKNDKVSNVYVSDGSKKIILTDSNEPPPGDGVASCSKGLALDPKTGKMLRICDGMRIEDRIWRELLNPPHP